MGKGITTHIGLFEGIGGFSIAAKQMGWETIAWCEINPFCQTVLKYHYPNAQGHEDIKQTDFTIYRGKCDVLTGGFPCQDASAAKQHGKGQTGLQGQRTGLFFEMCRAISEIRPKYVVAENVSDILKTNGGQDFARIQSELAAMGYNAEWRICRASEIGAPHHRARLYLVAYPNSFRISKMQTLIPYVPKKASPITWRTNGATIPICGAGQWKTEYRTAFTDDGISLGLSNITFSKWRNESIKALGNAVVPPLVLQIFKAIEKYEQNT